MAKAKIRGLDCSAPADRMIRLVLRAHVNTMCRYREQAINWRDPEGVHDMRVLSRRLRGAINDFRPYFKKGTLPRPKLRAIADSLGTVRDQDVALMALQKLKSQAKGAASEGIKLLMAERRAKRKPSRLALKTAVADAPIEAFRKDFLAKLQTTTIAVPTNRAAPDTPAPVSFRELGVLVIKARLKDFITLSSCLFQPYKTKELHELRILAKRLRYSMELFARCGEEELQAMAKEVAKMQTALGELHDCDVWIRELGARLKRQSRKAIIEPNDDKLSAAAIWLLKYFTAQRTEHYGEALALWEKWQEEKLFERIELLLVANPPDAMSESRAA